MTMGGASPLTRISSVARNSTSPRKERGEVKKPLLPRLQLARQRKQLGRGWLYDARGFCGCLTLAEIEFLDQPGAPDDARGFCGRLSLSEIEFLDPPGALFDLVGGNQDLPYILVGVAEMLLQLQHAIAQPPQIVAEIEHLGADLVGGGAHPRVLEDLL